MSGFDESQPIQEESLDKLQQIQEESVVAQEVGFETVLLDTPNAALVTNIASSKKGRVTNATLKKRKNSVVGSVAPPVMMQTHRQIREECQSHW
jgi:hypothetical protein